MEKKIASNISGILNIKQEENTQQAFFHASDSLITLIPHTKECCKMIFESTYIDAPEKKEEEKWLYGFAEDGSAVAFFHPGKFSVHLSTPVSLGTARFNSPIILKTASPVNVDLSEFDVMEFRGGIIDILHMTGKAVCENYTEMHIQFAEKERFTREFSINVKGEDFKLTYTIDFSDLSMDTGKVPDLRGGIHSSIRFEFPKPQPIHKFQHYYNYALKFFQFCSGRMNVNFDVRIHKKRDMGGNDLVLTKINDGFDDYAKVDIAHVIRFDYLGDKFGDIFKTVVDDDKSLYIMFLPKRNKNVGYLLYTDIPDLCVSLENEYDFTHGKAIKESRKDAKALAEELVELVNKSEHTDYVKEKAINLIKGNLPNLKPSLKEKICALYDEFSLTIKEISEIQSHVEAGITRQYSEDDFKCMIRKFVNIRNIASHAGVAWNEGIEIFNHLSLLMYLNVFKRAGYTVEESSVILSYLFGGKF